jgi:hypothetical protein
MRNINLGGDVVMLLCNLGKMVDALSSGMDRFIYFHSMYLPAQRDLSTRHACSNEDFLCCDALD